MKTLIQISILILIMAIGALLAMAIGPFRRFMEDKPRAG